MKQTPPEHSGENRLLSNPIENTYSYRAVQGSKIGTSPEGKPCVVGVVDGREYCLVTIKRENEEHLASRTAFGFAERFQTPVVLGLAFDWRQALATGELNQHPDSDVWGIWVPSTVFDRVIRQLV